MYLYHALAFIGKENIFLKKKYWVGSPDRFMSRLGKKYLDRIQLDWALKLILACNWTPDIRMYEPSAFISETMKQLFLGHSSTSSIEEL